MATEPSLSLLASWALPARRLLLIGACLAAHLPRGGEAVDKSKFRTCQQGSFCKRYRAYVDKVEGTGDFAHALDPQSVQQSGHTLSGKLLHINDGNVKPLILQLKWFRDSVSGTCGITRLQVLEESPLHPRFQLREGDVVMKEEDLVPDEVTLSKQADGKSFTITSGYGDCQVELQCQPFELAFSAGGNLLQRLNARHLLNFESYRDKAAGKRSGLVDATDVDDSNLWEEHFGGHTDSKPRGPAAVAVDVTFEAAPDVVGLAEHATKLGLGANKFSEPYRLYNLDVFEYEMDVPMALYGAVPLVTAVHRPPRPGSKAVASGFFFPNPSEGFVKVDAPALDGEGTRTWWLFESGVIDAFMLAGPTALAVLQQYHTVTGWGRMPPLSTLGKHQSRWNYVDVEDSIGVNKKFDQHDIPYDVLWLDIEHTDGKKYFTWHPTHFAKPDQLLGALDKSRRKLVTIVDPHIKKDNNYKVFTTIQKMDLFTKTKAGAQYDGWCWPGTSYYPDFCNPAMRDQWVKFFAMDYYPHNRPDLYTWNDMNEPSVFNGPEVTMPRDNLHKCHTRDYAIEHRDIHNVYGFYHHMATVQGQLGRAPNVRPFVLTRSFFAGSHRHGAVWTGDNMARWTHLERSVPMLVSLAMCGISFVGADVPGFFHDPPLELFKRWHQLGIWYPFYRGHAHLETKRREPWMFGDEVTDMVRDQVTVRYQLLPFWYTLFAEWALKGLPILRPLWFHDLDDSLAFQHSDNHFLVGEAILVRAIAEAGSKKLEVYLPVGAWFDHWDTSAAPIQGGRTMTVEAHPAHVPVFVQQGHILLKKMRRRRSTGAMAADPYSIYVYGPEASGSVYIDDGESHDYQRGAYLYEELKFDGKALRVQAAPPLPKAVASAGLPETPQRSLSVERAVFYGLPQEPTGAFMLASSSKSGGASASSEDEPLQLRAEKAHGAWTATIKKPPCRLGNAWSIVLTF